MGGFLEARKGLILGVANKRSVAWACAKALQREGMELILTYANERLESNVRELGAELGVRTILPCDVTQEKDIDGLVEGVGKAFGRLDCIVHAVAFAKREELTGTYLDTSKEGYHLAQEVSVYSLPSVSRRMVPLMEGRDGSILTLS